MVASTNLARRSALTADLDRAAAERCDVYLTELKAAAIDTVAERQPRRGRPCASSATARWASTPTSTPRCWSSPMPETVVVHRGHGLPYSKGLMSQTLSATGLSPQRAFDLARVIEDRLAERGEAARWTWPGCARSPRRCCARPRASRAVRRFRDWNRLDRLDRPLIVMVGGAAGVGKSTLATMLAHRLGITRVIATDVIRQVLRAFFTHEAMPVVHHSAFEVDLDGFEEQAELVGTGIEAIVERAGASGRRSWSRACTRCPARSRRRCGRTAWRSRPSSWWRTRRPTAATSRCAAPRGRPSATSPGSRRSRTLQGHLVARARERGVTVIDNTGADETLRLLMGLVLDAVGKVGGEGE